MVIYKSYYIAIRNISGEDGTGSLDSSYTRDIANQLII